MAGVYISYPFCAQKCTYCNFASGVFPRELESDYRDALRAEIAGYEWRWRPETLYIGGGTPSLLDAGELARLIEPVPGRPWLEATLEVAPGTVTGEKARAWRDAGIGRVSLGVQSFVDEELRRTGRKHTARIVEQEVALLRECGFAKINIDLIGGLAGQTAASWRESLDWVERLGVGHISVYMLEVDEDSRLGAEILRGGSRYGARDIPSDEVIVELYETAVERLARLGLQRYEISNFARPGEESRHNLKYWRLEPYAGFGAGAHSLEDGVRRANVEGAGEYVERTRRGEPVCAESTPAAPDEERFFVGLRLTDGIKPKHGEWTRYAAPIRRFLDAGLLETDGERLRLTARGVLLSNEVLQEFVAV